MDKWTILNLPKRVDRRYISVTQATLLGVPVEKIEIWEAMDAVDFGNTADTLMESIVADGFPELESLRGSYSNNYNLGVLCQLWNVCRFLRHLTETQTTEMFIHDGVYMNHGLGFTPFFGWFNTVVRDLKYISTHQLKTDFLFLTCGIRSQYYLPEINLIRPGSFISHGILSHDNFARVYSPEGAAFILNRVMDTPVNHVNLILQLMEDEETDFLQTPGTFSTVKSLFADIPQDWLGSNSNDSFVSYQGEYERLFPPEILSPEWKTNV